MRNLGPTTVGTVRTTIYWPGQLEDGSPLFYLGVEPVVEQASGECMVEGGVDVKNVRLLASPSAGITKLDCQKILV